MGTAVRRDELLAEIRTLTIEDRDYIEAGLLRDAYESGGRCESTEELEEIKRRAVDALSGPTAGYSLEDSLARARATVEPI